MKKIAFITIISVVTFFSMPSAFCQDTVRPPYSCYLDWPRDDTLGFNANGYLWTWLPFDILNVGNKNTAYAKKYRVAQPTKIYGVAATLWGQDTARCGMLVRLYNLVGDSATQLWEMRWNDSLPFRYYVYEAKDCYKYSTTFGQYGEEVIKAYEFYFDTPMVMMDSFLVGYMVDSIDLNRRGLGHCYLAGNRWRCTDKYEEPYWYWVNYNTTFYNSDGRKHPGHWGGLMPILHPLCNPDTVSCPVVEQLHADTVDSLHVRFSWLPTDSRQQRYQISIGPQGTPPDENRIFDIDINPYTHRKRWDTSIVYAAYVRAQCLVPCYAHDSLYWSDWSQPVFFSFRRPDPIGIDNPDSRALFSILPNPASESVTLTLATPTQAPCSVTLRDAAGHTLLQTSFSGSSTTLDTRNLAAGTYFLTIATPETSATRKLIIE